jgi:hypothetical protein
MSVCLAFIRIPTRAWQVQGAHALARNMQAGRLI